MLRLVELLNASCLQVHKTVGLRQQSPFTGENHRSPEEVLMRPYGSSLIV